jgi:hypothetical protein
MFKRSLLIGALVISLAALWSNTGWAFGWAVCQECFGGWGGSADLKGTVIGAGNVKKDDKLANVCVTITSVACYCRNKGQNADPANAIHFTGLNYGISYPVPGKFWDEGDENGRFEVWIEITDEQAKAAAMTHPDYDQLGCPNKKNWTEYCTILELDTNWDLWEGDKGTCNTTTQCGCEFADSCNVYFSTPDIATLRETGQYDVDLVDCQDTWQCEEFGVCP